MASTDTLTKSKVIEDSAAIFTARFRKADDVGTPVVAADITSVRLRVYDTTTPTGTLVVPDGEDPDTYDGTDIDPADVFIGTLNTGYLSDDDTGFNFRCDLHGSHFPEGSKVYRVEFCIVPVDADPIYRLYEVKSLNVFSQ
jgi:hypothetical protein